MNATNAVVENRLEPVDRKPETRPLVVTGQGLYDMFMVPDAQQTTRMQWLREYLVPNADPQQVKGACDELVKIAKKRDVDAGVPEKERGPKQNTAMQTRTYIQAIYGALKFAAAEMQAMGFSEQTGWMEARSMAKPALERAGKIWTGHDIPTATDREQKALARARKGETDAMLDATKATPRAVNESYESWQKRIADVASTLVVKAQKEKVETDAKKAFEGLIKKYDRNVLGLVANMLLEHLTTVNAGKTEISEEEANALLAHAEQAGEVEVSEEEHTEETPAEEHTHA